MFFVSVYRAAGQRRLVSRAGFTPGIYSHAERYWRLKMLAQSQGSIAMPIIQHGHGSSDRHLPAATGLGLAPMLAPPPFWNKTSQQPPAAAYLESG